jgi:hypothetical protein
MPATAWLQPWHDFFLLIGGASATLLGLVFVAASIAGAIPNEKLGTAETRALWTKPILGAFGRPLVLAAFGLVPGLSPLYFGCGVAVVAIADLVFLVAVGRGLMRHQREHRDLVGSDWLWNLVLPGATSLLILAIGVALAMGPLWPIYPLAVAIGLHLVIGVHNAWELADFLITLQ